MRHGDVLHPAKIGNVVDVADFVDICGLHRNGEFEGLRRLTHLLQYAPSRRPLREWAFGESSPNY
jgi:hypothetical protein